MSDFLNWGGHYLGWTMAAGIVVGVIRFVDGEVHLDQAVADAQKECMTAPSRAQCAANVFNKIEQTKGMMSGAWHTPFDDNIRTVKMLVNGEKVTLVVQREQDCTGKDADQPAKPDCNIVTTFAPQVQ